MFRKTPAFYSIVVLCLASATAFANTGQVTEVCAGDIVVIGESWRTRLLGISVPGPHDPLGYQAFDFTKRRIEGAVVKFFTYTTDNTAEGIVKGDDGLPFAKILFGEGFSNDIAAILLAEGFARIDENHLPEDCEHYRLIEAEARKAGKGLWRAASTQ